MCVHCPPSPSVYLHSAHSDSPAPAGSGFPSLPFLPTILMDDGAHSPPALVPATFQDDDDDDDQLHSPRVPFDIHKYFGLSPGTPICLDSLPDPPEGEKPQYTYATLVKLAIWSSPQRKLTLSGIYEALENRFSWFRIREHQTAWKVCDFFSS